MQQFLLQHLLNILVLPSIDQHLSFNSMADSVITQMLQVMSLIQCHFDYACSVWYTSLTNSIKISYIYTEQVGQVYFRH